MLINNIEYKIGLILTQWKRPYLEEQLIQIMNQTVKPDYTIVFQNENHVNIDDLVKKYNVIHVKSSYNTKYFGRFSYFFTIPVDICIVMDDDIIPGVNCIKNYVEQCINKNAIIGGNGRMARANNNKVKCGPEVGIRESLKYDFVGHMWCFKKDWLYYMFGVKPYTYDTGEDMHLCFSCKLLGNIDSYVAEHKSNDDCCDIRNNQYAGDKFASFRNKNITGNIRIQIQEFWREKGIKFVESN